MNNVLKLYGYTVAEMALFSSLLLCVCVCVLLLHRRHQQPHFPF